MKKILLIFPNYARGGAETAFKTWVAALIKSYDVTLLVNEGYSRIANEKIIYENRRFAINKILKTVKHCSPDAIVTFKSHIVLVPLLKMLKILEKKEYKIIFRESNNVKSYSQYEISATLKKLFFKYFLKTLPAHLSDVVICNSIGSAKDFKKFTHNANVEHLYNPISTTKIKHYSNFEKRDIDISFVGRLAPQKNPIAFLKIIKGLPTRNYNVAIIGSGALIDEVKNFINENDLANRIKLYPFQDDVSSYLKRSKLIILTSLYEGMPNTMLEGIKHGCNIISYDCNSGPREIYEIEKNKFIRIVGLNNIEECIKVVPNMVKYIPDTSFAREKILKQFSVSIFSNSFKKILNNKK